MTYYTLASVGYWASFEACCETKWKPIEGLDGGGSLLNHYVRFIMMNQFGHRLDMGFSIFTQPLPNTDDGPSVIDEDGKTFPNLDAAIRHHADDLLRITSLPGRPMHQPMRHATSQGGEATAFDHVASGSA